MRFILGFIVGAAVTIYLDKTKEPSPVIPVDPDADKPADPKE